MTHTTTVTCDYGETVSSETADCSDEDGDNLCDVCNNEFEMEEDCFHTATTEAIVSNPDKTHTITVTCDDCDEVISTETTACTDEDKDTYCDVCNAQIVVLEKISVFGANMTLGNDLKMNFAIKTSDLKEGYVIKVTQSGQEPVELATKISGAYTTVTYPIAAKEMTDTLICEVYNAEGYVVSNPFSRTVSGYAIGLLNNASQTESLKRVVVDMLNYGTEAQKYFHHNEDAYANAGITDEQQAQYATAEVAVENTQDKGDNFYGTNLSLEDCILMNMAFRGYKEGMTAKIEFTDFRGVDREFEVDVAASGSFGIVTVNQIVLGDAKCPVTVTVYDADGNVHGTGIDSVESYVARNLTAATGTLNMAIMKFSASAVNYLPK